MERIIGDHCDVRTIGGSIPAVCKGLRDFADGDGLWLRVCQRSFTATDPTLWISDEASHGQAFTSYKCVR